MTISTFIGTFVVLLIASRIFVAPAFIQRIGPKHRAITVALALGGATIAYLNVERGWNIKLTALFWAFVAATFIVKFIIGWLLEMWFGWNGPLISVALGGLYTMTLLDDPYRIIRDGLVTLLILGFPALVANFAYNNHKEAREKAAAEGNAPAAGGEA